MECREFAEAMVVALTEAHFGPGADFQPGLGCYFEANGQAHLFKSGSVANCSDDHRIIAIRCLVPITSRLIGSATIVDSAGRAVDSGQFAAEDGRVLLLDSSCPAPSFPD